MARRLLHGIVGITAVFALCGAAWVDPEPASQPASQPAPPSNGSAAAAGGLEVAGWTLAGGRLTVLFHGSEAAVERLRDGGGLSIQVHWLGDGDTPSPNAVTELPVGSARLAPTLAGEVERQGFFTWHSWAQRRGSSRGATLTWPDGTPLPCAGQPSCQLSFAEN